MNRIALCFCCDREYRADVQFCAEDGYRLAVVGDGIEEFPCELGGFRLVGHIATGETSTIYRAAMPNYPGPVALKIAHEPGLQKPNNRKRFQQEAATCTLLRHPNVVAVLDFGAIEGRPFLAMELLEGENLKNVIKAKGAINAEEALPWFLQMCRALEFAHQQGVVHRGLKPSEIVVSGVRAKLVDFGLSKLMPWSGRESMHLTKTGEVLGTAVYASPEQILGKRLEPATDIYSLGVVFYETLTGRPPFVGKSPYDIARQQIQARPPVFQAVNPGVRVPKWLETAIMAMLEKDVVRRPLCFKDVIATIQNAA